MSKLPRLFTLLQSGLVHVASQLTLLLNTLYSLTHFTLRTLCSQEHFASWNTLLPETLCFLEHFDPWTLKNCIKLWSKLFQGAKCSEEQSNLWLCKRAVHKRRRNSFGHFWYPPPPFRNFDPDLPNFYLLIFCNIGISDLSPPLKYSDVFYGWPLSEYF